MPNCIILLRASFAGNFNDLRTRPIIRLGSLFIFLTLISCALSFLCFSIILFICLFFFCWLNETWLYWTVELWELCAFYGRNGNAWFACNTGIYKKGASLDALLCFLFCVFSFLFLLILSLFLFIVLICYFYNLCWLLFGLSTFFQSGHGLFQAVN